MISHQETEDLVLGSIWSEGPTFRNCLSDSFRENLHIYGPYDFHVGRFVYKTITLCFLWGLTGYTYVRSLDPGFLETTDISALLTTNHTFVYMLSWIVLFEKFVPLRVKTSVSVGHVVCYSDSFLDFKHDFAGQRLLFRKKKLLIFFYLWTLILYIEILLSSLNCHDSFWTFYKNLQGLDGRGHFRLYLPP